MDSFFALHPSIQSLSLITLVIPIIRYKMKFQTIFSMLAVASSTIAAEGATQQGSVITQSIRQIERSLNQYDKAVRDFSGSMTNVLDRQYKLGNTF